MFKVTQPVSWGMGLTSPHMARGLGPVESLLVTQS